MRRKRNQSTAAAQKIMKERNYNLELIRMSAFLMVIAIHVTNYFCRAYGEVTTGEYLFSLVIDTLSRVSVPCFFMLTGALLLGRDEPLRKHIKDSCTSSWRLSCGALSTICGTYTIWERSTTSGRSCMCPPRRISGISML